MRAVLIFVAGGLTAVVALFVFTWMRQPSLEQAAAREIAWREKHLGYSCDEVYQRATVFLDGPAAELVRLGKSGGDWANEGYKKHRAEIKVLRDRVLQCDLIGVSKVSSKLSTHNEFERMSQFFTLLDILTTDWSGREPRAGSFKAGTFEEVAALHSHLTAASSGRPKPGAANTGR